MTRPWAALCETVATVSGPEGPGWSPLRVNSTAPMPGSGIRCFPALGPIAQAYAQVSLAQVRALPSLLASRSSFRNGHAAGKTASGEDGSSKLVRISVAVRSQLPPPAPIGPRRS
jgi:hypothetical protein